MHYLYLKEWKAAYAAAHVAGVPGSEKNSGVPHDGVWGRDASPLGSGAGAGEFKSEWFEGHPNQDVALLHVPSKTLIQADLLFNLPAKEQYSAPGAPSPTSGLLGWFGLGDKMNPWGSIHQGVTWNMFGKDKPCVARQPSHLVSLMPHAGRWRTLPASSRRGISAASSLGACCRSMLRELRLTKRQPRRRYRGEGQRGVALGVRAVLRRHREGHIQRLHQARRLNVRDFAACALVCRCS